MKIYFYFLESNGIRVEECEVYEKPKTYFPGLDGFPTGFSGCYLKKEDIGKLINRDENLIVLENKDMEYACDKFKRKCEANISSAKESIERLNGSIAHYVKTIEMIKEWKEKNV